MGQDVVAWCGVVCCAIVWCGCGACEVCLPDTTKVKLNIVREEVRNSRWDSGRGCAARGARRCCCCCRCAVAVTVTVVAVVAVGAGAAGVVVVAVVAAARVGAGVGGVATAVVVGNCGGASRW